jgi:hypothetical protein
MTAYTVQLEVSGDHNATVWQAAGPSETVDDPGTARDVAEWAANNQNVAYHHWRIVVWEGADADTSSPPACVFDYDTFRDAALDRVNAWEAACPNVDWVMATPEEALIMAEEALAIAEDRKAREADR